MTTETVERPDTTETALAAPAETAPALAVHELVENRAAFTRSRGIPFNGQQITKATADLPESQRLAVRWLYAHGMDKGDDLVKLGKRIDKNDNTLYRVFQGTYGAKLDKIVEAIETYRRLAEARDRVGRPPFISTHLSRVIWERCADALAFQKVAPIIGDWQIGKSCAVEEYARQHNHGQTRLIRLPSGSGYRTFLEYLARACYVTARCSLLDLREGILNSVDNRHLLIFDEIDEPLAGRFSTGALQIYAFIREVYDRRRCGIVLVGNRNFREALSDKGPFGPWMAKLRRRCLPILDLPTTAPDDDLWALAEHFALPEPPAGEWRDLARRIGETEGLGEYVTLLQTAKKISITLGREISWQDFSTAAGQWSAQSATAKGGR